MDGNPPSLEDIIRRGQDRVRGRPLTRYEKWRENADWGWITFKVFCFIAIAAILIFIGSTL